MPPYVDDLSDLDFGFEEKEETGEEIVKKANEQKAKEEKSASPFGTFLKATADSAALGVPSLAASAAGKKFYSEGDNQNPISKNLGFGAGLILPGIATGGGSLLAGGLGKLGLKAASKAVTRGSQNLGAGLSKTIPSSVVNKKIIQGVDKIGNKARQIPFVPTSLNPIAKGAAVGATTTAPYVGTDAIKYGVETGDWNGAVSNFGTGLLVGGGAGSVIGGVGGALAAGGGKWARGETSSLLRLPERGDTGKFYEVIKKYRKVLPDAVEEISQEGLDALNKKYIKRSHAHPDFLKLALKNKGDQILKGNNTKASEEFLHDLYSEVHKQAGRNIKADPSATTRSSLSRYNTIEKNIEQTGKEIGELRKKFKAGDYQPPKGTVPITTMEIDTTVINPIFKDSTSLSSKLANPKIQGLEKKIKKDISKIIDDKNSSKNIFGQLEELDEYFRKLANSHKVYGDGATTGAEKQIRDKIKLLHRKFIDHSDELLENLLVSDDPAKHKAYREVFNNYKSLRSKYKLHKRVNELGAGVLREPISFFQKNYAVQAGTGGLAPRAITPLAILEGSERVKEGIGVISSGKSAYSFKRGADAIRNKGASALRIPFLGDEYRRKDKSFTDDLQDLEFGFDEEAENEKKKLNLTDEQAAAFDAEKYRYKENLKKLVKANLPEGYLKRELAGEKVNVPAWQRVSFNQDIEVALNPAKAEELVMKGGFSAKNREEFKLMNPSLYYKMKHKFLKDFEENPDKLSYSQKLAVSNFVDYDITGLKGGIFHVTEDTRNVIQNTEDVGKAVSKRSGSWSGITENKASATQRLESV